MLCTFGVLRRTAPVKIFKAHKALAEQRYEYSCASPTALSPALQLPVECLKAVLHVDQEVVQAGKLRKS